MKKLFIVLTTAMFMFACNSNTKSAEEAAANSELMAAEWVEVVIEVDGMTCDGCENAIKAGVESLAGIGSVESSHEEGWTKVKYDKTITSAEAIEGKISGTGYVVKGEKKSSSL